MALSPALYHRFIKGQCTEEEEKEVLLYFKEHPEAMEEYLQWQDWEDFEPEGKLHPAVSDKVLHKVQGKIHARSQVFKILRRVTAAAVLIGSALLIWKLADNNHRMDNPTGSTLQAVISPLSDTQYHKNNGQAVMELVLEDGSAVQLHPNSQLHYRHHFDPNKREIWLKGAARFEVAQDSKRPFTVYTASIGTTALGTAFLVKENAANGSVTVKLYNGKVRIDHQKQPGQPTFAARYLAPGEELIYNTGDANPVVLNKNKRIGNPVETSENNTSNSTGLVYFKQPLPTVLQTLEQHFSTTISYDKKALSKIRVTAEFSYNDSLEQILEVIATLNNLQLTHTDKGFSLTK